MAAEGEFPKSDGDILYASEANSFAFMNDDSYADDTEETHTGNTNYTEKKSVTIGGGYSGSRLVFLSCEFKSGNAGVRAALKLKKSGTVINPIIDNTGNVSITAHAVNTNTYHAVCVPVAVVSGDTLTGEIMINGAGDTVYIKNFRVYGGGTGITFT